VSFQGQTFNYYNLIHPGNDLGNLVWFDKDLGPDIFIETLIEQTNTLIGHLYSILGDSAQYPRLKINDLVINDHGLYWRFLYGWDLDKEGFLAKLDGELEKSVQTAVHNGFELSDELLEVGRNKWKKTLNI
jgi:hypothetical protein